MSPTCLYVSQKFAEAGRETAVTLSRTHANTKRAPLRLYFLKEYINTSIERLTT